MDKYKDKMLAKQQQNVGKQRLCGFVSDTMTPVVGGSSIVKQTEDKLDTSVFCGKLQFGGLKVWPDISNAKRDGSSGLANPNKEVRKALEHKIGYLEQLDKPLKLRAPFKLQLIRNPGLTWASDDCKSVG